MIEFLRDNDKKEIIEKLSKYGVSKIPLLLLKSGQEKLRACSSSLSKQEIQNLVDSVYVESIGIYFAKLDGEDLRLSIDACHLLKEQLKYNVIELTEKQASEYLEGKEVEINSEQAEKAKEKIYYVLKHKDDILGMAKVVNKQIKNYLPKERRRKS